MKRTDGVYVSPPAATAPTVRRRRWILILAAITTLLAVVIGGGISWWFLGGAEKWARTRWTPPKQDLLSTLRLRPTPGWRTTVTGLGLPAEARINAGKDSWEYPIIKTTSNRTYVLASTPGPPERWWLAAIDGATGRPLFRAVSMGESRQIPRCFPNGIDVICVSDHIVEPSTAWVINGQTGVMTYSGPTDLRLANGAQPQAQRTPNYLLATYLGLGTYGIGARAERTWHIPNTGGSGGEVKDDVTFSDPDGDGPDGTVMFSVKDGRLWTPQFPTDADFTGWAFFDGGFAAQFSSKADREFVQLFDLDGKPLSTKQIKGHLTGVAGNLITVLDARATSVYDLRGTKLLEISGNRSRHSYLVGTTLWVRETRVDEAPPVYRAYDMRSGAAGATCALDFFRSIGTDGRVIVQAPTDRSSPQWKLLAQAYDLTTCEVAWSIPRPPGSLGTVARLGDTLVQLSDDGTELISLVNR
ncbi:hypothetical protein [Mycolicibacterium mucogenicum]|uniref:Uncharacterized protein n=1 Tax=Mycolicibacterium mucogenicum DSM 44124 TaxID=1226753 RepID=A0A8E4W2Q3_MYCMU|nr:hypothetical protein [Mycolicibacterium mucogenicum]QPG69241.1 hypothetical protein C1S78_028350 [Mycolicibacterium mucogenicum DSM 44124]